MNESAIMDYMYRFYGEVVENFGPDYFKGANEAKATRIMA
jgi:hypothetical protein